MLKKLLRNPKALFGTVIILLFVFVAIFAPYLAPGDPDKQVAIVSFNISGKTPSEVAMQLEEADILCRPGLHCAPVTHRTLGTFPQGTVRLSPGYFTSDEDIEKTLEAVRRIARDRE